MNRLRHQGTGDIGSPSGKCPDSTVVLRPVKSGYDRMLRGLQPVMQLFICFFGVQTAVFLEKDHRGRVDKFVFQIGRQHDPV